MDGCASVAFILGLGVILFVVVICLLADYVCVWCGLGWCDSVLGWWVMLRFCM